jgi:hypothetical protein
MATLYTLLIGVLGGVLGALITDFVRTPFRQFFTLRTEIRHEMLRLSNVSAPDPSWRVPTYSEETLEKLFRPSREAQTTLRGLGTRLIAFAETELIAANSVRYLGYDPLSAGQGSGDEALKNDYAAGDIYHALARMCGLTTDTDRVRWKKENPAIRDRMKKLQLGIGYGMGVPSLARGLDRHPLIASAVIERYKRTYPVFWKARADMVMRAMLDRRIESMYGWPLRLTTSPNKRTLYNFPMQSGGAEMLRLAAWRLCEAGIVPIMLIHDGILFEETELEKIEFAREIMLQAGRDVCDGFEIGVDTDQMLIGANHTGGARYYDKRPMATKLWATIMDTLEMIGAIPKRSAA